MNKEKSMGKNAIDKNVRIQGTQWDRKRRFTDKEVDMIKSLYAGALLGKFTVSDIARQFGTSVNTILYNANPAHRRKVLKSASGKHTGVDMIDRNNRIEYKKMLYSHKLV